MENEHGDAHEGPEESGSFPSSLAMSLGEAERATATTGKRQEEPEPALEQQQHQMQQPPPSGESKPVKRQWQPADDLSRAVPKRRNSGFKAFGAAAHGDAPVSATAASAWAAPMNAPLAATAAVAIAAAPAAAMRHGVPPLTAPPAVAFTRTRRDDFLYSPRNHSLATTQQPTTSMPLGPGSIASCRRITHRRPPHTARQPSTARQPPTNRKPPPPSVQRPSPAIDSTSPQLQSGPRPFATMSEERVDSPEPEYASTSSIAILNRLQQQQRQTQQQQHHQLQQLLIPFRGTIAAETLAATAAASSNMRSTAQTTLSPLEVLYWSNRLHSSSSLSSLPTAGPFVPLTQQNFASATPLLPGTTTLTHFHSQMPSRLDNQASLVHRGSVLNLPIDGMSHSLRSATHRSSDVPLNVARAEPTVPEQSQLQTLPALLTCPTDASIMSEHQAYLRRHIQLFCATDSDVTTSTPGRNRRIHVGQVGIQCRHCAHVPHTQRMRLAGTVYFPATTLGIYQASLNMSAMHLQCGRCPHMADAIKQRFVDLIPSKNSPSMVGRKYWAKRAVAMFGLVDTDRGIFVGNHNAPISPAATRSA